MTLSGGHGSKNWVRDFQSQGVRTTPKGLQILKSGAPISLWHRSFVLGRLLSPNHLRLPEKLNRVVVQDPLFLGFREIIAREDLFCGVVPSFAVRQIGGIKNLI